MSSIRVFLVVLAVVSLAGCGGKKEKPAASAEAVVDAGPAVAKEPGPDLGPFFGDPSHVLFVHEKNCPEGLWALFPGPAPGGDDAKRKENEAKRSELVAKLRGQTFVAQLRGPPMVQLGEYDQKKGEYPIELTGLLDCEDSIGRIAVAFNSKPKASLPEGRTEGQWYWMAQPQRFAVPVAFSELKAFENKNKIFMDGRIVFQLGKTETHQKLSRFVETKEAAAERKKFDIPGNEGGTEDWGAGRLVHAKVTGIRIATNKSKEVLLERQ